MRQLNLFEISSIAVKFVPRTVGMHRFPYRSREEIRNYQLYRLKQLVSFAYDNVAFYRQKYDEAGIHPRDIRTTEDFKKLPTVTKQEIIANYPEKMIASGVDLNKCIVSKSSGSSGMVMEVVYDIDALVTYILAGLRIFTMAMKYYPWDKQVYIYTSPYPLDGIFGAYRLYFIPTVNDIADTVSRLKKIKPQLIVCYPSHLRQMSKILSVDDLRQIKPKAISVNSEMSTQKERDELAAFFGCGVYDEYSTEELTRVAAQCKYHRHHIFEDINFIETLDAEGNDAREGEPGEIVGTNLHNFCMPFIRYKQSDIGAVVNEECACKRNFRILKEFKGRKNDQFILPSGKILSSGFLLDASYALILEFKGAIDDFCIIQEEPGRIVIEIIPGSTFNGEISRKIEQRFKVIIKEDICIEVNPVDKLYKTKTGKLNPIISKVKHSDAK